MTHPSLERLEMTHPSLETLENDLKQKSDLIQASRDLKMTYPSLERLGNDSSNLHTYHS
jgi:hypothetical protein